MPGHTFLYSPPVTLIREMIDAGELGEIYFISTSRVNLGLHQRDVSVAWDLGPHDFSILRYWLAETPTHASCAQPRVHHPGHARRRLHQPRVSVWNHCAPRALVAGADEAAADDDRRLPEDGPLRRHEPKRARPCLRLGRDAEGPGDVRRVPAHLSNRRHRVAAARGRRAALSGADRFLHGDPDRHGTALLAASLVSRSFGSSKPSTRRSTSRVRGSSSRRRQACPSNRTIST